MNGASDEPRATTEAVDLTAVEGSGGVVWSLSPDGVHVNLVVLAAGDEIERHRNDEVDVVVVALAGDGIVTVEGEATALAAGHATLIRRGTARSIGAGPAGIRYLTVHAPRRPLTIGRPGQ